VSAPQERVASMRIYVAGPLHDIEDVRAVQDAVTAAGHVLCHDWTRAEDAGVTSGYAGAPEASASIATAALDAVMSADAVLVVASGHDGRGMFVELGAALARASTGSLRHVVVIGAIRHDSAFYHHPSVLRVPSVHDWLALPD
jgi:hypothetical protein